ncbi:MAG: tRNA lysidine(34) synthetase TilS [Halochromatium sp.]
MTVRFGRPRLPCRQPNRPSRTLKNLFQQSGVPAWLRPYVPLLVDGQGDLLAVAGVTGCGCDRGSTPGQRMLSLRWERHPWTHLGLFAVPVTVPVTIRIGSGLEVDA